MYALGQTEEDRMKMQERIDDLDERLFDLSRNDIHTYERKWQLKLLEARNKKVAKVMESLRLQRPEMQAAENLFN